MATTEVTTPARVAIYAHVSTNEQSPKLQLHDLRQYATARGLSLTEYVDTGFSGAKQSRPALDRLMDGARKRRFDCVLVWRFDRFARSTKHLLLALEEFRSLGIQFISYQENIDTTSPLGQALFTIVSAVAQLERDLIRERVCAGLRNARAKGKKFGRPRAQVDPASVAALRSEGLSWSQICQRLKLSKGTAQRAFYTLPNHPQESSVVVPDFALWAG
jgi:DNA invertase Pin-like site-specific DNA recombinase